MGGAPSISRRALAAALAPALAALLPGCGVLNASQGERDVFVQEGDEAGFVRRNTEEQLGMALRQVVGPERLVDSTRRFVTYSILLSPEEDSSRVFGAYATVEAGSGRLVGEVKSDYSQYLFKERAEAPFRSVLAGFEGLAGWAARLTKARFASKPWRAEDFDAYMGSGGMRDPSVEVVLMMPRGRSVGEWAEIAAPCFRSLYGLRRAMEVSVAVEGADYRKSPLRAPYADEKSPSSRSPSPGVGTLEEDFSRSMDMMSLSKRKSVPWDGNGNPDGKPFDPGAMDSYSVVHWNPGHGPSAW